MKKSYYKFFISMLMIIIYLFGNTPLIGAAEGTVKVGETQQEIIGCGASLAWYGLNLVNHSQRNEIYSHIFEGLRLDILRIRNQYGKESFNYMRYIIEHMYTYSDSCILVMSSWSPTADLKSNNSLIG
ncbi:MAG: hypothetical protein P8078_00495 [bacterium]